MQNREAYIRNDIVMIGMPSRVIILLLPFFPTIMHQTEWFRMDQRFSLMTIIVPVSCIYLTFFIKFITQNRYQKQGKSLSKNYISFGVITLALLSFGEIYLILQKGLNTTSISDSLFFFLMAFLESGFAIYAGFYLSDLFGQRADNKANNT